MYGLCMSTHSFNKHSVSGSVIKMGSNCVGHMGHKTCLETIILVYMTVYVSGVRLVSDTVHSLPPPFSPVLYEVLHESCLRDHPLYV